jgi:hypothetical protein
LVGIAAFRSQLQLEEKKERQEALKQKDRQFCYLLSSFLLFKYLAI